jgi:hypothetical protein
MKDSDKRTRDSIQVLVAGVCAGFLGYFLQLILAQTFELSAQLAQFDDLLWLLLCIGLFGLITTADFGKRGRFILTALYVIGIYSIQLYNSFVLNMLTTVNVVVILLLAWFFHYLFKRYPLGSWKGPGV